jgi:hypothetical protein
MRTRLDDLQKVWLSDNWELAKAHFLDHAPVATIAAQMRSRPQLVRGRIVHAWELLIEEPAVRAYGSLH